MLHFRFKSVKPYAYNFYTIVITSRLIINHNINSIYKVLHLFQYKNGGDDGLGSTGL
jgi:hypothetical protein